jgi:hypothetical protein
LFAAWSSSCGRLEVFMNCWRQIAHMISSAAALACSCEPLAAALAFSRFFWREMADCAAAGRREGGGQRRRARGAARRGARRRERAAAGPAAHLLRVAAAHGCESFCAATSEHR